MNRYNRVWRSLRHRFRYITVGIAIALTLAIASPLTAQEMSATQQSTETAEVVVEQLTLFEVADTSATESAEDRAAIINARIERYLADPAVGSDLVTVQFNPQIRSPVIYVGDLELLTVTAGDLAAHNRSTANDLRDKDSLAETWQVQLQDVLRQAQQERQQGYIPIAIGIITAIIAAAIVAHWLAGRFWRRYLRPTLERLTFHEEAPSNGTFTAINLFIKLTLLLVRASIWGTAIYYSTRFFLVTRQWRNVVAKTLYNSVTTQLLPVGDESFSLLELLLLLTMIFLVILGARAITNLLSSRVLRAAGINRGLQEAIAILSRYLLIIVGTIVVLQLWGLDLSSLTLLASALGIGIGLGLQNIAKDIGSGLVLVFERPIQVGDFIEFSDKMGTVERIGIRSTEVRTLDQVSIIVPNSQFLENEVTNWSHRNPLSRIHIPIGVAYACDPETVRSILLSVGRQHPEVVAAPAPQVFFQGFGDSALNFDLLVWIRTPSKQPIIKSDINFAIAKAFQAHEIDIPFPQRDLNLANGELPISLDSKTQALLAQFLNGRE
ncbi:MAG: mechanosensitive ion channel domain-containing protein [Cyanobacteria bacterium P01_D01_bin.44]